MYMPCPQELFGRPTHRLIKNKGEANVWVGKAERWLDLPDGALSGEARLELEGRSRLTVQGACDIVEYETDCIRIRTKSGDVRILGHALVMEAYHTTEIAVSGQLLAVEFV